MVEKDWAAAAMTDVEMVAELLIRMKQPTEFSLKVRWRNRKSRSKPSAITTTTTTTTNAVSTSGLRKEQVSGSPTTPLYWSGSGGGGASTSDGYDESSRRSDLSSGGRFTKGGFGNEGASTSSYKKSRKRKSSAELKEEEDVLLKERLHLSRELKSMRQTMKKQIAKSENYKNFKTEYYQTTNIQKIEKKSKDERETEFVLPDLNMAPDDVM